MNRFATTQFACLLALSAGLGACASGPCDTEKFPSVSGTTLFVAASCGSDSGTGAATAPFATIGKAAAAATPGTTIAVAAGTYKEALVLGNGVGLVGIGSKSVIVQPPAGASGLSCTGTGSIVLQGFRVDKAAQLGISVTGGDVTFEDVEVSGTTRGKTGTLPIGGHGVQITDAKTATMPYSFRSSYAQR